MKIRKYQVSFLYNNEMKRLCQYMDRCSLLVLSIKMFYNKNGTERTRLRFHSHTFNDTN